MSTRIALGTLLWAASSAGQCPMQGTLPAGHPPARRMLSHPEKRRLFEDSVKELDFEAVRKDLVALYKDSKDFWPADYGNYAPFMVRFTWHHAGTYRSSDGVGGIEGAHQRFDPSRSWQDNTNLVRRFPRLLGHAMKLVLSVARVSNRASLGAHWTEMLLSCGC
eukprot:4917220-Pleurochrysis_carterae.AAC.2